MNENKMLLTFCMGWQVKWMWLSVSSGTWNSYMKFVFETILFWVNDVFFATVCYFILRSGTKQILRLNDGWILSQENWQRIRSAIIIMLWKKKTKSCYSESRQYWVRDEDKLLTLFRFSGTVTGTRKTKASERQHIWFKVTLSTINPTWITLGLNSRLYGQKPPSNKYSHGDTSGSQEDKLENYCLLGCCTDWHYRGAYRLHHWLINLWWKH